MITEPLPAVWAAVAPALADHLWQSTLFAVVAGLLTLVLRKNRAGARYGLWLAASLKFLLPFSLLSAVGSRLSWLSSPAATKGGFSLVVEEVSQPFTRPAMMAQATASSAPLPNLLPILLAVWLGGFLTVLLVWYVRWRRISSAIRDARPLREGREWEALCRLQSGGGGQIEMLLSRASLEPGIFGVVKPVMVWPQGISARLDDAHLEAILAHELRHVRRRDNLAAVVHMLVEAVFWFHPLVWWLGARLVEERELACDEEVVELGGDRQVYAESILKVCEFCVGSPLACVSGVTGADLKKRIVHIMTKKVVRKLDFGKKLLLSAIAFMALALPITFGFLHATPGRAESVAGNASDSTVTYTVSTIKPSQSGDSEMKKIMFSLDDASLVAKGITLHNLLEEAYGVQGSQISGEPEWVNSEKYDIEAKVDGVQSGSARKLGFAQTNLQNQRMLRALLADRFKLTLHLETKEQSAFALVIADSGLKLQESKAENPDPTKQRHVLRMGFGHLAGQGIPLSILSGELSRLLGSRTVLDETGLTGKYDFTLRWAPDESQARMLKGMDFGGLESANVSPSESPQLSLADALREQLGLELKSQQTPVQILAIDHVEKPTEN